jgi:hypothetical protein
MGRVGGGAGAGAGGPRVPQIGAGEDGGHGGPVTLAVGGIEVGFRQQHERQIGARAEGAVKPGLPQAQLVPGAQAVAILGPVEHRRRRGMGEDQQRAAGGIDGHDPVAGGREALDRLRLGRGEGRAVHLRHRRAGQVAPEQRREVLHRLRVDGPPGQQDHATVAREAPVALGVTRVATAAVAIHVEAGGHSGVRSEREDMGVAPRGIGKGAGRHEAGIMVEFGQQQDIRGGRADDGGGGHDPLLLAQDVAQKQPRTVAGQGRGIDRDADRFGGDRRGQEKGREQREGDPGEAMQGRPGDQAVTKLSSSLASASASAKARR